MRSSRAVGIMVRTLRTLSGMPAELGGRELTRFRRSGRPGTNASFPRFPRGWTPFSRNATERGRPPPPARGRRADSKNKPFPRKNNPGFPGLSARENPRENCRGRGRGRPHKPAAQNKAKTSRRPLAACSNGRRLGRNPRSLSVVPIGFIVAPLSPAAVRRRTSGQRMRLAGAAAGTPSARFPVHPPRTPGTGRRPFDFIIEMMRVSAANPGMPASPRMLVDHMPRRAGAARPRRPPVFHHMHPPDHRGPFHDHPLVHHPGWPGRRAEPAVVQHLGNEHPGQNLPGRGPAAVPRSGLGHGPRRQAGKPHADQEHGGRQQAKRAIHGGVLLCMLGPCSGSAQPRHDRFNKNLARARRRSVSGRRLLPWTPRPRELFIPPPVFPGYSPNPVQKSAGGGWNIAGIPPSYTSRRPGESRRWGKSHECFFR